MSRIALILGIDDYPSAPLTGCVADATAVAQLLRKNADGSANFSCRIIDSSTARITRGSLRTAIIELFDKRDADIALLFFAGHGSYGKCGGLLVTQDASQGDEGIAMADVIGLANKSKAKERVIILDCCHSGAIDELNTSLGTVALEEGVSILVACRSDEAAMENAGRGVFSSNICDALGGGAADVRGFVTIAAAYAYVVEVFTHWNQRPLFRASLSRVSSLRRAKPAVSDDKLRRIMALFPTSDFILPLSPAYEPTEAPKDVEKEEVFAILQQFRAARLLEPVGDPHLYYAAVNSKGCGLTPLGRFYWRAIDSGKI